MPGATIPKRLYGALAETAHQEGGLSVHSRVKSMAELERLGWVERRKTGEVSPMGNRFEVWVLTDAGRDALRAYLEG